MICRLERMRHYPFLTPVIPISCLHPLLPWKDLLPETVKWLKPVYIKSRYNSDYASSHLNVPLTLLSSIIQPSFPKVTATNFTLGSLKRIETSACGIVDASVHACKQRKVICVYSIMLKRKSTPQSRVKKIQ